MKYRKKPIVIEAVQFENDDFGTKNFHGAFNRYPQWLREAIANGMIYFQAYLTSPPRIFFEVKTLEGVMRLKKGGWLIRGVKGELYPCKDEIFKMTYERAEE